MSLFQRLTKSLRPSSLNPASTFRAAKTHPHAPQTDPYFFGGSRVGLGLGRRRFYSSPPRNESTNTKIIWGIIGLNTGIFCYSNYLQVQADRGDWLPWVAFRRNMSLSLDGLRESRYWTLVTHAFTHHGFMHLLGNMFTFYYLAGLLAPTLAPFGLVTLIVGSGVAGTVAYLTEQMQGRKDPRRSAVGFSSSVMGVASCATAMYPMLKVYIWGVIPMPLWVVTLGYVVYDTVYLDAKGSETGASVAHSSHLGGLVFGALFYFAKVRGLRF